MMSSSTKYAQMQLLHVTMLWLLHLVHPTSIGVGGGGGKEHAYISH